jgi:glycosyltransferase involved in cell wall biosynthesis
MPNYPTGKIFPGYGGFVHREEIDNIKYIRTWIYPTKSPGMIPRLINYFSFVFSSLFGGAFLLSKADFFLTESPPLFVGISSYVLSKLKRARWIFNVSDLWPDSAVNMGVIGMGTSYKISKALEKFFYRKSWLTSGQSNEFIEGVKETVPGTKTYHLSNGADVNRFNPALRSEKIHSELGDGAECVAVYAGLHGMAQGLDQIVEAAKYLEDLNGKLKIVFIGDGPDKDMLIKNAADMNIIKFLDPQPKEQIPGMLASSDIALVPLKTYIHGAVPSKIYEAMASAIPILLVAEGESTTILNHTQSGVVIQPGEIKEIAENLKKLSSDADLRGKLGNNGRTAVMEKYNRNKIYQDFIEFLSNNNGQNTQQ